jgi:hypothetical protein
MIEVIKKLSTIIKVVEEGGEASLSGSNILIEVRRWPEGLKVELNDLLKLVRFIIIMILRSLISSFILYLAISMLGVFIILIMLLIFSRKMKLILRS